MDYLSTFLSQCTPTLEISALSRCTENWVGTNIISLRNCIYLILDGEGEIILNHTSYLPKAGDVVIIPYGTHVSYHTINKNGYYKYWCHFQAVHTTTHLFDFIHVPFVFHPSSTHHLEAQFRSLTEAFRSTAPFSPLCANGILCQLIAACLSEIPSEQLWIQQNSSMDTIHKIDSYIRENLSHSITLNELAELVHFHPNYFIRFFNKHFSMSPMKYIAKLKIDRAKQLLVTSDLSISKIAIQLGYSSAYHFSNRFKEATGYTPSAWRDMHL